MAQIKSHKTRVLVTGAAGFLGRYVTGDLVSHGCQVVAVVRPNSSVRHLEANHVRMIVGDLRDKNCIAAAFDGAEVVVHAAAASNGGLKNLNDINIEVTRELLKRSVEQKVQRFVFISQNDYFILYRRYVDGRFTIIRMPFAALQFPALIYDRIVGLVGRRAPSKLAYMHLCKSPFYYTNDKIKRELGWRSLANLRNGVEEMMR